MKKTIITVLSMLFVSSLAFSQGLSGGIKAGLNFANQNFESSGLSLNPDGRTGFHGGVYLTAMFTEKFGIQPEVYYSMQGSKFSVLGSTFETKVDYVSIPVLFRYNVTSFLNLHAGPQFGLLLKAEQSVGSTTDDIKDDLKSGDFGAAFGVGVDLPMGFNTGLRYVQGFSNIDDTATGDDKLTNKMFQLYVGYRLFGKKD
jgi:hypothetical protein